MGADAVNIVYTRQALTVMRERDIAVEWIEQAVREPDETLPDPLDGTLTRAFRKISERDDRILRVVFSNDGDAVRIVTVFFDRGRRRR